MRQGDAHSWVEVYVARHGWQTFDPTPPSDAAPRSELSGVLAFMRDVIEATSQRWDRYVVGYDLRQQVYLFETISRYGSRHASPLIARIRPIAIWGAIGAACSHRLRHLATPLETSARSLDRPKILAPASESSPPLSTSCSRPS